MSRFLAITQTRWFQPLILLLLVLGLHYQWLMSPGALIGAPQSDVIRGVWGFDHQARGFPSPFWTDRVGFPEGVKLLILPFASSYLAAPLVWLIGAIPAYNLWILLLSWGTAVASAFAARALTRSPWSGWLAGGVMATQPMMFLAITDGTPENVAFWSVPLFLGLMARAFATPEGSPRMAVLAGFVAALVALDSPYHAIFTVPLMVPFLWAGEATVRARLVGLLATLPGAAIGIAALYGLYYGIPMGIAPDSNLGNNATQLRNWVQWEQGSLREPWDWTFSPSFIPFYTLIGCTLLALINLRRSAGLLGVALLCLAISLGPSPQNARILGDMVGGGLGQGVTAVLQAAADFQATHPIPGIRFLRRWLVPTALALALAAELGASRYKRLWAMGPVMAVFAVGISVYLTSYPQNLPLTWLPQVEAAQFIAQHEVQGVTLILPRTRAATRLHQRDELPVFANLGHELSSASELFLQVMTEQPSVYSPNGLITMVPRTGRAQSLHDFFRDLDDLTLPQTIGNPIPPSATQNPEKRQKVADFLFDKGLRFVLIDEQIFGEVGLALVKVPFANHLREERHFADGSGITVLVLE